MSKEDLIELQGVVTEVLAGGSEQVRRRRLRLQLATAKALPRA